MVAKKFEAYLTALGLPPATPQAGRNVTATLKAFAYAPRCADLLLTAYERIGQRFDALHRRLRSVPYLWGDTDRQFRPRLVLHVGRLHRLHADAPLGRKRVWFLD